MFLTFSACLLTAQVDKSYHTWYLGHKSGMKFNNGTRTIITPGGPESSQLNMFYGAATICDKTTGNLLFYTNGYKVYTSAHTETPKPAGFPYGPFAIFSLILPHPGNTNQFYIFTVDQNYDLRYCIADRSLNGGIGDIAVQSRLLASGIDPHFTAVKQLYDNGYWLITHRQASNTFAVYKLDADSFYSSNPVISNTGEVSHQGVFRYGNMITNSAGDKVVFTSGTVGVTLPQTEVFDFDKRCGTLSFSLSLLPFISQFNDEFSYAAYSPNDRFLYVSYFSTSGTVGFRLHQYNMTQADPNLTKRSFPTESAGIGDLQLAPDGLIYVSTADGNNSTPLVGLLHDANLQASYFIDKEINLSPVTPNYTVERFPGILFDKSVYLPGTGFEKPKLVFGNLCEGLPVSFGISNTLTADSVRWFFGDGESSPDLTTTHLYAEIKSYPVELRYYNCGFTYVVRDTVKLGSTPVFNLGDDTTLCPGVSLILVGPHVATKYEWSTGDSVYFKLVTSAGKYKLKAWHGSCFSEDEITIQYHPNIWTQLGDEYLICDRERELVKLDAGEGFQNYRWLPTGDTTQWIEVSDLGSYFVIVNDFRGCKGEDSTTVKRRCPVRVFFPNAFTPNGDGLNDFFDPVGTDVFAFEMTIYNRWGEQIFNTTDLGKKWNGKVNGESAQDGVYFYMATYSGYQNKRFITTSEKGMVTLIR